MGRSLLILFSLFWSVQSYAANLSTFFSDSDRFLQKWVLQGKVDYAGVKHNFQQIDNLYKQINDMPLAAMSDADKKAFYINAYNLIVIYQVSKYYPLKSPMNQSGFFDKVTHVVAGESMTLNALEIEKIVLTYHDPRIHFAVACAAFSCPELASRAYLPEKLDQQLDRRTAKAVNDPNFIRVKNQGVAISKIFNWYKRDFTQTGQDVLAFINNYRTQKIPTNYSVTYYDYNWALNEQ